MPMFITTDVEDFYILLIILPTETRDDCQLLLLKRAHQHAKLGLLRCGLKAGARNLRSFLVVVFVC